MTPMRPRLRRTVAPKLGRSAKGTLHTVLNAFWTARATPCAPQMLTTNEITST